MLQGYIEGTTLPLFLHLIILTVVSVKIIPPLIKNKGKSVDELIESH